MEIAHLRKSRSKYITLNNRAWAETIELRNRVCHEFVSQGCLALQTFNDVLDWKLGRQRKRTDKHRRGNAAELIRELTGAFWRVQHCDPDKLLKIKLSVLQSIPGVGIGVASTILTLSDPAHFAIIDFRNWEVLYSEEKHGFSVSEYKKYLVDVRNLASQLNCDVQEIDFVLWNEFDLISTK
jgi:hypothetical protein